MLLLKEESYAIMGACFEVCKTMGCGFLEAVYQECLGLEFEYSKLPFVAQPQIELSYKNRVLKQWYQPDFVCYSQIVVEIKAVSQIADEHRSQLLNYLHATNMPLGLLVNFGHSPQLEWQRLANTHRAAR